MHIIASGSKGNASVVYSENTYILVDLGTSKARLISGLEEIGLTINDIDYALFTHEHTDHIKGEMFIPDEKKYALKGTINLLKSNILQNFKTYEFGDFKVTPIKTSHDATSPCGFIFETDEEKLVYITDTGIIPTRTLKLINNADYYFFESNHDVDMLMNSNRPYFLKMRIYGTKGHLNNEDSAFYMSQCIGEKTKKIVLAHISEECNTPEIALKTYQKVFETKDLDISKYNVRVAKQWESMDL